LSEKVLADLDAVMRVFTPHSVVCFDARGHASRRSFYCGHEPRLRATIAVIFYLMNTTDSGASEEWKYLYLIKHLLMRLLKTQKNELFEIIEATGLSPNSFFYRDPDVFSNHATEIGYRNSNFRFSIRVSSDNQDLIIINYSPGASIFDREEWLRGWAKVVEHFDTWVNALYDEITVADKWERLNEEVEQVHITYENETNQFSAFEYEDLKIKMHLLKSEIRKIGLPSDQLTAIESKLDHLTEIGLSLSKFDWKSLFVGTIISIIIQLSVTPDNAKTIWGLIRKVFTTYFLP
jgi:hypothetical protein